MIYLICDSNWQADLWIRQTLCRSFARAIRDGDVVVLNTYSDTNGGRLQGRRAQPGDEVVRINFEPFGPYWHQIEDLLAQIGFEGQDSG